MKLVLFVCMILISLHAHPAHAAGRLKVELRKAQTQNQRTPYLDDGLVELVLKNDGDQMIEVSKDDIPMTNRRGNMVSNSFTVIDAEGRAAPYIGIVADYDESQVRTVRIPPRQSVVTPVSIAKNYRVSAGQSYTVSLRHPIHYLDRPRELMGRISKPNLLALMKSTEATSIRVVIDARTDVNLPRSIYAKTKPQQCNGEQISLFNAAKSTAMIMSREGAMHANSLYSHTPGPDNNFIGYFSYSLRYTQWFGVHGSPFDPLNMNPINDEINLGLMSVMARISDEQHIPKPTMSATCQCTAEDLPDHQIATAWVDPNIHYVINTCERFWQSPHLPTSRDENSKVGTIIHEAVHFYDSYWSGSQSHYAVSYADTMNLAIANRALSSKNPNTYRFYHLNQPW